LLIEHGAGTEVDNRHSSPACMSGMFDVEKVLFLRVMSI